MVILLVSGRVKFEIYVCFIILYCFLFYSVYVLVLFIFRDRKEKSVRRVECCELKWVFLWYKILFYWEFWVGVIKILWEWVIVLNGIYKFF